MQQKPLILALLAGLSLSGTAHAALYDRGGGLIYDDVLKITWLQNASYAGGWMTWNEAVAWTSNLSYYDTVRNVTYTDWRLPTMVDTGTPGCNSANSGTDCHYNVQTYDSGTGTVYSELAYMYHVNLGLKAYSTPTPASPPDFGIFGNGTSAGVISIGLIENLQVVVYWSGLEDATNSNDAWGFNTYDGHQAPSSKYNGKWSAYYAWAVRPGDVAAVPEPETYSMLLAGLGMMGWVAQRRKQAKICVR